MIQGERQPEVSAFALGPRLISWALQAMTVRLADPGLRSVVKVLDQDHRLQSRRAKGRSLSLTSKVLVDDRNAYKQCPRLRLGRLSGGNQGIEGQRAPVIYTINIVRRHRNVPSPPGNNAVRHDWFQRRVATGRICSPRSYAGSGTNVGLRAVFGSGLAGTPQPKGQGGDPRLWTRGLPALRTWGTVAM